MTYDGRHGAHGPCHHPALVKLGPSAARKVFRGRQKIYLGLCGGFGGEGGKLRPQSPHGPRGQLRTWLLGVRVKVSMDLSGIVFQYCDE